MQTPYRVIAPKGLTQPAQLEKGDQKKKHLGQWLQSRLKSHTCPGGCTQEHQPAHPFFRTGVAICGGVDTKTYDTELLSFEDLQEGAFFAKQP